MALKFEKIIPIRNITPPSRIMNGASESRPSRASVADTSDRLANTTTAPCEILPHAEAAHQPRVQERGERDAEGDRGERQREQPPEMKDIDEDLLRREQEAEHRAEHQAARQRVADRVAVAQHLSEGIEHAARADRAAVLAGERLGEPQQDPRCDDDAVGRQEPEDEAP